MPSGPIETYLTAQIKAGTLREDKVQLQAAAKLDGLLARLKGYSTKSGLFGRKTIPPKGLYMWGGVGRGKSLLMDLFFENLKTRKKSRVHFHAFMQDVHTHIARWRKLDKSERRRDPAHVRGAGDDPIAPTAKAIAAKADILCFDEFHVTDITDAMILSRLFTALFERGVVVVATSNRQPDTLYKDGLNRQLFLPFIELLKDKLEIFEFEGDTDHRLRKLQRGGVFFTPLNADSAAAIEDLWERLTRPAAPELMTLNVQGRSLSLLAASGTARASFEDLCDAALGAADYLAIANTFSALVLEGVPQMGPENRNAAKRFVTLVDALYESKTKLIMSAEVAPDALYIAGDGAFEFERTVSRLTEMQSKAYLAASHEAGMDSQTDSGPA